MFSKFRVLRVACVTACLVAGPWTNVFGQELQPGALLNAVRNVSFGAPADAQPSRYARQERGGQSVATTTESKLLLGLVSGGLIVGGMTMMAYGASATCKGREGTSTTGCDRTAVIGAMSLSGGAAMLLLWALSR